MIVLMFVATVAPAQDELTVQTARKRVALTGYTRSRTKQILASEVSGKVLKVNYDVGQTVGSAPFLEIDVVFIDFQIEHIQWSVQKLQVTRLRNISQTVYLEKEFNRIDRLHTDNVATQSNWERAAEELEQARLSLQATELELKALAVQLQELKERRRRHRLMAPQGWVVIERRVEQGEIIATGTPVGQVADFTQLVVPLYVSALELEAIRRPGWLAVNVADQPVQARLNWVNPEFDERTRKWAVELVLENYPGEYRGGLLTELIVEVVDAGLMVPREAVTQRYDNPFVVLHSDGRKVPVVILGETADHVLIAGQPDLRPGMVLKHRSAIKGQ